jgi:hypothetical protein
MNLDWLEFDMAGQTNRISGEVDWQYQVVDVPPGSHTLTWRYYKSQQGSSGLDAAWLDEVTFQPLDPLVDSDGDGLSNLIEYSVGSDPLDPTDANTGIINFITQDNLGNRYLAMQYKSRNDVTAAQLRYAPEVSADKLTWYSDWKDVVVINVTAADSTFNWVTVRDATPITPAEARFMRLHVLSGTFPSPSPGPGPTYLLVHGTVRSGVVESTSPICVGTDTVIRGSGSLGSTTTLFSQRMVSPILSAGKITSISSSGINDTNAAFVTGQFGTNGMPAYLEFDNGTMLDIVNTTPQSVSLVANVTGLAVGDAYRIRAHSTVASIFGINNAAGLTGGPNASQADTVTLLIPETQQTITLFYYANPSFTTWEGWVRQDTFSPDPNEIIYPEQGIMIRRIIPGDLNLFLCGPIKSGPTVVPVQPGYNLVGTLKSLSTVPVSGLNLFTGFSSTGVIGGTQPSTGDNLIMVNQDGSVATFFYFYSPGVFQGWVNASGYTLAGGVLIPPGTAFFINRHGLGGFTWTIPAE